MKLSETPFSRLLIRGSLVRAQEGEQSRRNQSWKRLVFLFLACYV